MEKKFLLLSCFLPFYCLLLSTSTQAQTINDVKAQMVKDWERAKAYTIEYLNTMPTDKYTFRPQDSIRNFSQQMLHLAQANVFLMSNATDLQMLPFLGYDPEHKTSAWQKDSVMN